MKITIKINFALWCEFQGVDLKKIGLDGTFASPMQNSTAPYIIEQVIAISRGLA